MRAVQRYNQAVIIGLTRAATSGFRFLPAPWWEPSGNLLMGKWENQVFWAGSHVRPFDFSSFTSFNNLSVLVILFPSKKLMSFVNGSGPKDGGCCKIHTPDSGS